jgi:hypothetical protein
VSALALAAALAAAGGPALLGDTVRLDLGAPEGWTVERLEPDSSFALVWQRGDSAAVIPLCIDTLRLPALRAWRGGDTLQVVPPAIAVARSHPDSTYPVAFPDPLDPRIPRGLPADYAGRHRYWAELRHAPTPWMLYAGGALLLAALAAFLARWLGRGRKGPEAAAEGPPTLSERAEALLESPAYGRGDWEAFYAQLDAVMRSLVAEAAGIESGPLTWTQLLAALSARGATRELAGELRPLAREVVLQRYAGWGSSRQKAASDVRRLAALAGRWCG